MFARGGCINILNCKCALSNFSFSKMYCREIFFDNRWDISQLRKHNNVTYYFNEDFIMQLWRKGFQRF